MKNKQLILMILSLSLILIFFLPWISIQKGFDMFAESGGGYSGFSLVSGIHFADLSGLYSMVDSTIGCGSHFDEWDAGKTCWWNACCPVCFNTGFGVACSCRCQFQ